MQPEGRDGNLWGYARQGRGAASNVDAPRAVRCLRLASPPPLRDRAANTRRAAAHLLSAPSFIHAGAGLRDMLRVQFKLRYAFS